MFWEYLVLEALLIVAGGASLFWGTKGVFLAAIILTIINYYHNYLEDFWHWEPIIIFIGLVGIILNYFLDKKTQQLRIIKVSMVSAASLLAAGAILPLIPAFLLWSLIIGLPLLFTYRQIPRALYLQVIFKFIFFCGWLIIGNIIY
ncbi:MAG: hypothetical protein ACOX3R_05510 [Desulfitobacteriia bacterium]